MADDFGNFNIKFVEKELADKINDVLEEVGKDCADEIKANAPKRKGDYANGWTYKVDRATMTCTVYNKGKNKTLGHLLEFGHASRFGTNVPPQPHIMPAFNKVREKYLKDLEQIGKDMTFETHGRSEGIKLKV